MEQKHILHLPKTSFPMKARLPEREPEFIEFWQKKNIYQQLINKTKEKELFSFVDGPPYANGNLHIGHALNKVLKDIVVKYMNLSGRHCPFIPVWDCHGLPVELATLKKIPKDSKKDTHYLRKQCRKEALFWVDIQKKQFERLGVIADWASPLLTMDLGYTAHELRALAKIAQKGLLYRGKKPVYWCSVLKTAIASSEVEYRVHKSPSIYVKFPFSPLKEWNLKNKTCSIVIWTTTPWTLPANQAICLNPHFTYAAFETLLNGKEEILILAEDLKDHFEKTTGIKLNKKFFFPGKSLEYKKAKHPFIDRDSLIILGDYVTKEEGTGCVHTAPGHGLDDFISGKKYDLPVLVPVDEGGVFTTEVKKWEGIHVLKANPLIIKTLQENSCLLSQKEITHSYPFNPRSGAPLIFRATNQWFIRFDHPEYSLRKKALNEVENAIQFYPNWGKARLSAMINNSPDWCLSRQRHWGVPIPVFYCKKCQHTVMDPQIINQIADQMEELKEGIEYWFNRSAKELLPNNFSCPVCQNKDFEKGKDILDVWFDSGVCHYVFKNKYGENTFPADIYLEGSDQHRGWFQTSLNSSVCLTGKTPFKSLVTHCFVNDAEGYKMSKSKGNVIRLADIIKQKGAEIIRLWVCSENYSQDLLVGQEIFARVSESYRRFRNTIRFMLGNLSDFEPETNKVLFSDMKDMDKWILGRLSLLINKSKEHYESFLFHKIYQDLNVFFTTDLSALYLDILKDRLYTFKKEGQERRSAQSAIYFLLDHLLSVMAPILTFLSEEAYQYLPGEKKESILLKDFPTPPLEWDDSSIREKFEFFLHLRQMAYSSMEKMRKEQIIGSSLETKVLISLPDNRYQRLRKSMDELREFLIVSQVELKLESEIKVEVEKAEGEKCIRCWNYSKQLNNQKICLKCISNLP